MSMSIYVEVSLKNFICFIVCVVSCIAASVITTLLSELSFHGSVKTNAVAITTCSNNIGV